MKIKKTTGVVLIWTVARYLRATWGIFDSEFYNGILVDLSKYKSSDLLIPMIIILIYIIVEVGPFLIVLDWGFMELFTLETSVLHLADTSDLSNFRERFGDINSVRSENV